MIRDLLLLLILFATLGIVGGCGIKAIQKHEQKQETADTTKRDTTNQARHTYKDFTKPTREKNF
jgi:hypothetical protein